MRRLKHMIIVIALVCCGVMVAQEAPKPDKEILVPMRDGVSLPTNLFFPNHSPGKYPCVLIRQPLGRDHVFPFWLELTKAGYTVAMQSTRSSCDASGKELPYLADQNDGYDAVEWLATSEWSTGKVAVVGMSATGIAALLMAPSKPPHLACQYLEVSAPSLYDYVVWPGGSFRKEQVEGWLKMHKSDASVFDWLHGKAEYDQFWQTFDVVRRASDIATPQVHIGGWYDIFLQGTIDGFSATQAAQNSTSPSHKLIIGPWGHKWKFAPSYGDFDPAALQQEPPHPITMTAWLDYYVKGVDTGISKIPQVQYYVMGPMDGTPSIGNRWRVAHKWPPHAAYVNFYLTHDRQLIGERNSSSSFVPLTFASDSPVPTIGGRNLFLPDGPRDISSIESRKDVLAFTTQALDADVEVTGRVYGTFCVQDVAQERDLCCRLTDVYPNGKSIIVAEGICHLRPKQEKEQVVVVDLWSTSMVFAKNHKIRLTISASNFPAYETNLTANPDNSDISFSLATGGDKHSYIALPVIRHYELPPVTICSNKGSPEVH